MVHLKFRAASGCWGLGGGREHPVLLWITARSLKLKHWNKKKKKEIKQGQISLSPSLSNRRPSGLTAPGPRTSLAMCWLKHPSVASRWHGQLAAQLRTPPPPNLSARSPHRASPHHRCRCRPVIMTHSGDGGQRFKGRKGGGEETSAKVDRRAETRWQSPAITLHSRGWWKESPLT